jgi:hypothetical protein
LADLNLKTFDRIYPMVIHKYNELIDDQNASVTDKINSIIEQLNVYGKLSNDVVKNWNNVYQWTMNDGLTTDVNNKLESMIANGELNSILNSLLLTDVGDLTGLQTTAKNNLVSAVNEVVGKTNTNATNIATNATNIASNTASLAEITSKTPWAFVTGTTATDIQNAINSLPSSGGIVYFANTTYSCNSAINFNKSNVRYVGEVGTLIVSTIDGMPFNITGTDITFENIGFKHDIASTVYGVTLDVGANVKRLKIDNCRFYGKYGRINISNLGISDVTINKCYFEECTYSVLVNSNSSDMRRLNFTNNILKNSGNITLNTPNTFGVGIKEVVISNNVAHTDIQYLIDNNMISTFKPGGLCMNSGASDVVVSNNTIDGYYLLAIDFEDEAHRVSITGNKIKNCYGDGKTYIPGMYIEKGEFIKYKPNGATFANIYWAMNYGIAGIISNVNHWVHDTNYNVGDYVWSDKTVYKCTVAGTSGSNPLKGQKTSIIDGTATWTYVNINWITGTAYTVGQRVLSNGVVYQCTTAGTSGATTPTGTGTSISDGACVWNSVDTSPVHSTGQVSDGGVNWQYLCLESLSNWPGGFGAGINLQDVDYVTITGNILDRAGQYGIMLEKRTGYVGSEDKFADVHQSSISGNVITRCDTGIFLQSDGSKAITVNGNTTSLNTNGIKIDNAYEGLHVSGNMISENTNGLYIGSVFADVTFGHNHFTNNINPITLQSGVFRGGFKLPHMNAYKRIWTASGANTGVVPMIYLGNYANGTITVSTLSNTNDYANQIYSITWDGTTLTQTRVYSYYNGQVGSGTLSMSGSNIAYQLTNANSSADYVRISVQFDGVIYMR